MYNLTYVNGMFAALTDLGMSTSSNGVDWTDIELEDPLTYRFLDVAYGGDQYVVVGAGTGILFTYAGYPTQWPHTVAPISGAFRGVAYGARMFVAVGDDGIVTSFNVEDWVVDTNIGNFAGVTFGNGRFVAVGYNRIVTSMDGRTWPGHALLSISPPSGPPNFSGVAFGNGRFVAVAQWHGIYSSEDGLTWQLPDTAILPGLKGGGVRSRCLSDDLDGWHGHQCCQAFLSSKSRRRQECKCLRHSRGLLLSQERYADKP